MAKYSAAARNPPAPRCVLGCTGPLKASLLSRQEGASHLDANLTLRTLNHCPFGFFSLPVLCPFTSVAIRGQTQTCVLGSRCGPYVWSLAGPVHSAEPIESPLKERETEGQRRGSQRSWTHGGPQLTALPQGVLRAQGCPGSLALYGSLNESSVS